MHFVQVIFHQTGFTRPFDHTDVFDLNGRSQACDLMRHIRLLGLVSSQYHPRLCREVVGML